MTCQSVGKIVKNFLKNYLIVLWYTLQNVLKNYYSMLVEMVLETEGGDALHNFFYAQNIT